MSKIHLLLIGILIIGGAIFLRERSVPITNYPSSGDAVVAFGDSLIEGVGATAGGDLVTQLSKKIGEPIVNLGIAGNTTAQGLARVDRVLEYKPKVVIVLLGGNDFLRKVRKEETFKNLDTIVTKIQDAGAVVVLLGVQGGVLGDPYKEEFESLAKRRGTVYVPNVLRGLMGRSEYMADAVHPNNTGYAKIAERIAPEIKKVLE